MKNAGDCDEISGVATVSIIRGHRGERIRNIVIKWDYFAKDTVGKQWIRAADSMAANLAEGFGRFYYKESKQFGYYSRGSLYEAKTWATKAHNRNLISKEDFSAIMHDIETIALKRNKYIQSIGKQKVLKNTDVNK